MKSCLEKYYISSQYCKERARISEFFGAILDQLGTAVCNETADIPVHTTEPDDNYTTDRPNDKSTTINPANGTNLHPTKDHGKLANSTGIVSPQLNTILTFGCLMIMPYLLPEV